MNKYFAIEGKNAESIPASALDDILRELDHSFKPDPRSVAQKIKTPELNSAWNTLRATLGEHAGKLSDDVLLALEQAGVKTDGTVGNAINAIRARTDAGIKAQKQIVSAIKRDPIGAFDTGNLAKIGRIENVAADVNLPELGDWMKKIQAARQLSGTAEKMGSGNSLLSAFSHMLPVRGASVVSMLPGAESAGRTLLPAAWDAVKLGPQQFKASPWHLLPVSRNMIEEKTNE